MQLRPHLALPSSALVLLAATTACNPQSADVEGTFTAFLSVNTSQVFVDDKIPVDDFENVWRIDCRGLPADDPNILEGALDVCADGSAGGYRGVFVEGPGGVLHEQWINRDAFVVGHEQLDAWRGEAIQTSEGDIQLTFHHRLPGGEDFRFAFVVDPEFQPRTCVEDEAGNLSFDPIDGDWIGEWSDAMTEELYNGSTYTFPGDSTDGTLFLLNSGAYQFNPDQTTAVWRLPEKMEAGYARARFGPEEMFFQTARYGLPRAYLAFDVDDRNGPDESDLFLVPAGRMDPDDFQGDDYESKVKSDPNFIAMMRDQPEAVSAETGNEFAAFYDLDQVDPPDYSPVVPTNAFRRPDNSDSGFDRWGELHYSWVRFDQPREQLTAGEAVSGEFRLYFFGANSQSRVLVEGRFESNRVRKDTWTVPDVREEQREEADVALCGGIPEE